MQGIRDVFRRFMSDEAGLETVEYAIITGLIVAGTIASVTIIGQWVQGRFENMVDTLNLADSSG